MAKSKKNEAAGAKDGAKKSAKSAGGPAAPEVPPIDAGLAAATAAKLVAHKDQLQAGNAAGGESAAFKQLKESLHKPAGQNGPGFLQSVAPNKKFGNTPGGPRNQNVGRNQTFGADVNRSGVPRRTGG